MGSTKVRSIGPRVVKLAHRVIPSHVERIRGGRLQQIRRAMLQQDPLCTPCKEAGLIVAATIIDHIVPLWAGGPDAPSNRQRMCDGCHTMKTNIEIKQRFGNLDGVL